MSAESIICKDGILFLYLPLQFCFGSNLHKLRFYLLYIHTVPIQISKEVLSTPISIIGVLISLR